MEHYCWDCKSEYECLDPLNLCPHSGMTDAEGASIQCPECYDIEHGESSGGDNAEMAG